MDAWKKTRTARNGTVRAKEVLQRPVESGDGSSRVDVVLSATVLESKVGEVSGLPLTSMRVSATGEVGRAPETEAVS